MYSNIYQKLNLVSFEHFNPKHNQSYQVNNPLIHHPVLFMSLSLNFTYLSFFNGYKISYII